MTEQHKKVNLKGTASSSVMNRCLEETKSQENRETWLTALMLHIQQHFTTHPIHRALSKLSRGGGGETYFSAMLVSFKI